MGELNPEKPQEGRVWWKGGLTLLVLLVLLNTLAVPVADPDLWGYLAFGRLFWEGAGFPYQDVFSYVPTLDPWIYHEWGTGVLFYPLYRNLGAEGLQLLKYGFGLATAGLIYVTARRRGADALSAALFLWMVHLFLVLGYSAVRAQVFTYAFFALYAFLLEEARRTGRWRFLGWLVPVQVVWCNLHGGFVAGLGLVGLYAVGEGLSRRRCWPYLLVLAASGLATLINPYGLDYWRYIFQAVTMPRPEITEWVSVFRAYKMGLYRDNLIYFGAVVIFSGLLMWWARWREFTPLLALAATLILGLKHLRHQVFFLLLAGAYLPGLLSAYGQTLRSRAWVTGLKKRLGLMVPAVFLAVMIPIYGYKFLSQSPLSLKIPPLPGAEDETPLYYPVGAVDYLRQHHLSGKVLLEFHWGEYVSWLLYPQCRVALDGRYETVYPEAVCREYFDFLYGRLNWRQFLEHYPPDFILIEVRRPIYQLLTNSAQWRQVYADPGCAMFRREGEKE
jgi:hypothetical protein